MKKTIYTLLIIFTFSCISIKANAITTMGAPACGDWINAKEQNTNQGLSSLVYKSWLAGYLSGIAGQIKIDALNGANSESMYLWVDNYCRANPLEDLSVAGLGLFLELAKQKRYK